MKKNWSRPEVYSLGLNMTKEEPAAPPWQDCGCNQSGNEHIHGAQTGKCDCCDIGSLLPDEGEGDIIPVS